MKNPLISLSVVAVLGISLGLATAVDAQEIQKLSVGVVPQQAASKLARDWVPILDYLGEQTGYELVFRTAPDIPTFETRLARGEYDIAYMNPYHYAEFSNRVGYVAFAHQKYKKIKGIIVVRKDSDIEGLEDLSQHKLAFPSPAAFAASILPRAKLQQKNIVFNEHYVSSHDSVYRAVAKGIIIAGGGIERTLAALDKNTREQLRVLWTSDSYTPHAFAAHPSIRHEVISKLKNAMISMESFPEGLELLNTIKFKGIQVARDSDWDDIRKLKIMDKSTMIKAGD